MLRLIGILIGSALAVALLIIAFGLPRFSPAEESPTVSEAADPATTTGVPEPVESETIESKPLLPEPEPPVEEAVEISLSEAETEALIEEIFSPQPRPVAGDAEIPDAPVTGENWYAFWSPFRSEIAANGFIARLQETTGIDYRVVKVKAGVYEVAFAYVDDADIQDKLARISNATGLDMTGG